MSTLFGRMKGRPRQSSVSGQDLNERSVPYDKLSTPARSPVAVGTFSQGLKGISAPNTNPALTASGTELNIFTLQRSRLEREKAYDQYRESSAASLSSADSSTLFDDSIQQRAATQNARMRRSEASSSTRSQDFGQYSPGNLSSATMRPASGLTTRSESNRSSKYAVSVAPSEPTSHHSHISQFYHRHHSGDTFHFPRPDSDETIEVMFQNVKRTRDLGELPDLPIEQKWQMVYNDEHIRWREDRQREEESKKQTETGQATAISESPEWYIKKFLDKTITAKQATSLLVSLRSKEVRCGRPSTRGLITVLTITQLVPEFHPSERNLGFSSDSATYQSERHSKVRLNYTARIYPYRLLALGVNRIQI